MNYFEEIKKELLKFKDLGLETSENRTLLIGRAPHIAELAWLNEIYPVLNLEDIVQFEEEFKIKIPDVYKFFLLNYSNGLNVFVSTLSLFGIRKKLGRSIEDSRQPFDLKTSNVYERPNNSQESFFFIGSYNWDGSRLYIDTSTNKVHYCDRYSAISLVEWDSFEIMLRFEIRRIIKLFDNDGVEIEEDIDTTPRSLKSS